MCRGCVPGRLERRRVAVAHMRQATGVTREPHVMPIRARPHAHRIMLLTNISTRAKSI
jgi:hypothetical protein